MSNYFEHLTKVEEIKTHYRGLMIKYLGQPEVAEINEQYIAALKGCNKQVSVDAQGVEHIYYFDEKLEREIIERLLAALNCRRDHAPDCKVFLVGWYIWIYETKKEQAAHFGRNGLRFLWHSKKEAWYWKPAKFHGNNRSRGTAAFGNLAAKYGCREITEKDRKPLENQIAKTA